MKSACSGVNIDQFDAFALVSWEHQPKVTGGFDPGFLLQLEWTEFDQWIEFGPKKGDVVSKQPMNSDETYFSWFFKRPVKEYAKLRHHSFTYSMVFINGYPPLKSSYD